MKSKSKSAKLDFSKFDKSVTASEFASLIGLHKRNDLFIKKKYESVERKTVQEWLDVFIKDKVISETPSIFVAVSGK